MSQTMKAAIVIGVILAAGGIALGARAQQTARPGEPTQAHVWVENRARNEAIPVIVDSVAAPITVHLDSMSSVQTFAGRQTWDYRSIPAGASADVARALSAAGAEGWEAVGVLQPGTQGATVLLKRPR